MLENCIRDPLLCFVHAASTESNEKFNFWHFGTGAGQLNHFVQTFGESEVAAHIAGNEDLGDVDHL